MARSLNNQKQLKELEKVREALAIQLEKAIAALKELDTRIAEAKADIIETEEAERPQQ